MVGSSPTGRTGRGRRPRGVLALVVVTALGGCVDVGRDEEPVLVTAQEMERLGYERPEMWDNSRLQHRLLDNREQIYAAVRPWIEDELGVRVEMTSVIAPYPWDEASVGWRTVDEPVFTGHVLLAVGEDGTVPRGRASTARHRADPERALFPAVYAMAYRPELDRMRAYLAQTYPELTSTLPVHDRVLGDPPGTVGVSHDGTAPGAPDGTPVLQTVWQAFREDPVRSDREWRALLDRVNAGMPMGIGAGFMMREPGRDVPQDLVQRVAEDLRDNPLFDGYTAWGASVMSNLHVRDDLHPHHFITVQWVHATRRWVVTEERDGVTVQ